MNRSGLNLELQIQFDEILNLIKNTNYKFTITPELFDLKIYPESGNDQEISFVYRNDSMGLEEILWALKRHINEK